MSLLRPQTLAPPWKIGEGGRPRRPRRSSLNPYTHSYPRQSPGRPNTTLGGEGGGVGSSRKETETLPRPTPIRPWPPTHTSSSTIPTCLPTPGPLPAPLVYTWNARNRPGGAGREGPSVSGLGLGATGRDPRDPLPLPLEVLSGGLEISET